MTFLLRGALGFFNTRRWFRSLGHGLAFLGLGMGLV
jgi:hypothetical protein